MANPRIDELRKKLDKEPGSRLFAQLAEELRKDGDLAEAVRVARSGLDKHPNYPSARMTLGRALLDSGDLLAARREFEAVLKGAPDNILAGRFLAECLEGLGQDEEALARYRTTLALAPGEKHILARVEELEARSKAGAAAPAPPAGPPPPSTPAASPAASEPPPIRVAEVDESLEVVPAWEQAPVVAATAPSIPEAAPAVPPLPEPAEALPPPPEATSDEPPPIPLVPVEEEFELDRPYEAPPPPVAAEPPPLPPPVAEPEPAAEPLAAEAMPEVLEEEFDVDQPSPLAGPPQVTFRVLVEDEPAPASPAAEERGDASAPGPVPEEPAAALEAELASPTLGELYFNQGILDKAVEVYRRLAEREPGNERHRARLAEIEAVQRHLRPWPTEPASPGDDTPAGRREAIERTIARLLDLRAALARRG